MLLFWYSMLDLLFSLLYLLSIAHGPVPLESQVDIGTLLTGIIIGIALAFSLVAFMDRREGV